MERYNFRTTSLNNDQLNSELLKRGAKTFGTLKRKQERLQRFIDAEENRQKDRETLRVVMENERRRVVRHIVTTATGGYGRTRISQLLNEYLGY